MKFPLKIVMFLVLFAFNTKAQCPPTNPTATISGMYSLDLNPAPGSITYVTPTATITGNINLNNASLYNCGTILSRKIIMRQSVQNNQYILENNNIIKCDSILLDSLGHLHNNDTLNCNFFKLSFGSNSDNNYLMDVNYFQIETKSQLNSQGKIKVNYFNLVGNNSLFYNQYGNISVRKLFRVDTGSVVAGVLFICVDSCFTNNGVINNSAVNSWTPSIKIIGSSTNTGTINSIDFCDLSTTNGGMPDINTGTLSNITFCQSQQYYCDYSFTSIKENVVLSKTISVFPNPATAILSFQSDTFELEDAEIEITNYLGQIVLKKNFSRSISVAELNSGYYNIVIKSSTNKFYSKFVKD